MAKVAYTEALGLLGNPKATLWMLVTADMRMLSRFARRLADAVVPDFADFNVARLDCARTTSSGGCLALCEELPVMAERRLVWLRDVHLLDKDQASRLASGLGDIPPTTTVLLTASPTRGGAGAAGGGGRGDEGAASDTSEGSGDAGSGGGLKSLTSLVEKSGLMVSGQLTHDELVAWVNQEAPRRGLQASPGVLALFVDRVGDDYTLLDSELDKLLCYVGTDRPAREADVALINVWSRSAKSYELASAIDDRDTVRALATLRLLLEQEEHPLQILGLLGSHYRTLLKVRAARSQGLRGADMAGRLKVNEYRLKHLLRAEQRYQRPGLDHVLEMLLRADEALKSGRNLSARIREVLVLETLIVHLCG